VVFVWDGGQRGKVFSQNWAWRGSTVERADRLFRTVDRRVIVREMESAELERGAIAIGTEQPRKSVNDPVDAARRRRACFDAFAALAGTRHDACWRELETNKDTVGGDLGTSASCRPVSPAALTPARNRTYLRPQKLNSGSHPFHPHPAAAAIRKLRQLVQLLADGCKRKKIGASVTEHEKFGYNKETLLPVAL